MITFKTIKYKNFLSSGNVFTKFDLDKHATTLICGPNGSGKSAVLDALCFVLYNKSFRKVNKPQLVNSINQKEMLVEINFTVNTNHYRVVRGMKPVVFEIYKNGDMIEPPADNKDYQLMLENSVLRMSYKTFVQVVLLGSANFVPFMQLPAAGRREIIENLLDIDMFTTMNVIVKDNIKLLDQVLSELDNRQKILENTIKLNIKHRKQIDRMKDSSTGQLRGEIDGLKEKMHSLDEQCSITQTEIEKIDDDDSHVQEEISELNEKIFRLEMQLSEAQDQIKFLNDHSDCPTCNQGIDADFRSKKISDMTNYKNSLTVSIEAHNDSKEYATKELDKIRARGKEKRALEKKLYTLESNIATLSSMCNEKEKELKRVLAAQDDHVVDDTAERHELKELLKKKKRVLEEREIDVVASELLKDSGIKSQIIRQYIPVINQMINQNLAELDFFCMFEFDENFDEVILSRYRDEFSYGSFSQGERMRIDLALLFAFRELSRVRNASPCNILFLDEVMDSSLDSAGTDEFIKIISTYAKKNNIFVISHKHHQINDSFSNVIKIEKKKNFSRKAA